MAKVREPASSSAILKNAVPLLRAACLHHNESRSLPMTRLVLLAAAVALSTGCNTFDPSPRKGLRSVPVAVQQQAQKSALAVVDLLENGHEERARAELKRILALDPYNRLAQSLQRQITADPMAMLGRDWFVYVVRPNDTLSSLAGRYLGDANAFYILARYNDIRVPNQMANGQQIRIPGRPPAPPPPPATAAVEPRRSSPPAPPPVDTPRRSPPPAESVRAAALPAEAQRPSPLPAEAVRPAAPPAEAPRPAAPMPQPVPPAPAEQAARQAEAAERAGDLDGALAGYRRAAMLNQPGASARVDAVRKKLVAQHSAGARGALARQDLDGSIRQWDRVLEIDPGNDTARLERQRAVALREKVRALK